MFFFLMSRRPQRSTRTDTLFPSTTPFRCGGDRWAALLAEHGPEAEPGRVLRHDGVAVQVRTPSGDRTVKLRRGVEPITVGDWLALDDEQVLGLLPRASLLRRRAAGGDDRQLPAANLDPALPVCGLRPEERRVGEAGVRTRKSRGSAEH